MIDGRWTSPLMKDCVGKSGKITLVSMPKSGRKFHLSPLSKFPEPILMTMPGIGLLPVFQTLS